MSHVLGRGRGGLLVLAACIAASALARSAKAQIFQPGTQPMGEPGGIEAPLQAPGKCQECHGEYDDAGDAEPWDSWRGSMMGNAGRDPVFRAALAIAEEDHPDAADFCVRCHSMPAWLRGRASVPEWSEADGPRLGGDDEAFLSADLDGVGCAVCHQVDEQSADPEAPYLQNAQLVLLDGADATRRIGPYPEDPAIHTQHAARESSFLASGDFCGQCHDIVNPVVMGRGADGASLGRPFAIERTYSEWKHSAFADRGETCQDCHMPLVDGGARAAKDGPERAYYRRHDLIGASTWVADAIAAALPARNEVAVAALGTTRAKAEAMLAAAAELEVTEARLERDVLHAAVRVTNRSGHKLPTGYPEGRRMWLEVEVRREDGTVLAGSGRYDQVTGELEGDAAPRTYEVKLGQGSEPSFHFVLNDTVLVDTRIPPEGFAPPEALDMGSVGRDYGLAAGAARHYDDVNYELPVCGEGPVELRVRLRMQATTREYIEFLRREAPDSPEPGVGNWGERALAAWLEHGGDVPVDMAEAVVPLGTLEGRCPGRALAGGGGCAVAPPGGAPRRGPIRAGGALGVLLCLAHLARRIARRRVRR